MTSEDRGPCFGIDLGTTCSTISVVEQGAPRLLAVEGEVLLPSVVSFPAGEAPLVGRPALNRLVLDPERTIRSAKRQMGSEHVWHIDGAEIRPADVGAMVIGRLLDAAEAEAGARPRRAVITVPAWFSQAQRADTRRAGEAAGLTVERIINEPTAAALAHAQGQPVQRQVLVYDLGGGTFDVSVVSQDGPLLEVLASHGDSRLGGDDIDDALVAQVLSRVAEDDPELSGQIAGSPAARLRLRAAVEEAKIALSGAQQATLRAPFLMDGPSGPVHLELELERAELIAASAPLLERTLQSVDQVLRDAGLEPDEIDELLLVGGATLAPQVWQLLHERYGLEGSHAIPPRTAVALGAAIQGAIIDGSRVHGVLVDVAPYSLSAGAVSIDEHSLQREFSCTVITPRNTPLPSRHTERLFTSHPSQRTIKVPIYQGAARHPGRNVLLSVIEMSDLPPAPAGRPGRPLAVEFRHDLDGMVDITVTDELSGQKGTARLAADGEASAALHEEVDELIGDLPLGGEPPDEEDGIISWSISGPEDGPVLDVSSGDDGGDLDEARRTFGAVLAAEAQLRADHPAHVEALLEHARRGRAALAARPGEAVECYDALSDLMFDAGIYL